MYAHVVGLARSGGLKELIFESQRADAKYYCSVHYLEYGGGSAQLWATCLQILSK